MHFTEICAFWKMPLPSANCSTMSWSVIRKSPIVTRATGLYGMGRWATFGICVSAGVAIVSATQQFAHARGKGNKLCADQRFNGERIDVAKIIMHQNTAKTADSPPGNIRVVCFLFIRNALRGLGQGLQITQSRIIHLYIPKSPG